jgi:glutamyl-tRNA synthetase
MKTRFCPSPTGYLHLGNVRTALFSALLTMANSGDFLLRIEDTDRNRSDNKFATAIMDDLKWLGLEWDEGPGKNRGNEPYWQSQRQEIYQEYYDKLVEIGAAYYCFCSEEQLVLSKKAQRSAGKAPRYSGICRSLSKAEIEAKIVAGVKPTIRFKIPDNKTIEFIDIVKGDQRFSSNDIGDFIIRKADGSPSFMFCNAVDDSLMGITHVIRGEDHLTNTPRQLMILDALGLNQPEYGHISLIMGYDGGPLSKRHGSSSINDMKKDGVLAGALVNYLARLGHYYKDNSFMSINELADKFKVESLSKSAAKFDHSQLTYWQKTAIAKLEPEELWQWMGEQVRKIVPQSLKTEFITAVTPNITSPDDALHWASLIFGELQDMDAEKLEVLQQAGSDFFACAIRAVEKEGRDFNKVSEILKQELGVKGKSLFMPLRIALTGEKHGPELMQLFKLLKEDIIKDRLRVIQ